MDKRTADQTGEVCRRSWEKTGEAVFREGAGRTLFFFFSKPIPFLLSSGNIWRAAASFIIADQQFLCYNAFINNHPGS